MRRRCFATAVLLLSIPAPAHSKDDTLAPVIVTATRTSQTVDDTLASVTVITRQDIDRQQAQTLQDILQEVPGVEIANSGGPGEATSVFLRGTNEDHVLVLIDGIKAGSTTLGTMPFEYIPADQIERIEIVRGPRSSLYGSQAIGGVIQIFTRKGGGPVTPTFSAGVGNYHTDQLSAGVSGGGKQGWYNVTASRYDTGGINACQGNTTAGCFAVEPDNDGYLNTSGSVRAGYRFSGGNDIDVHVLRAEGYNQFDGTISNQTNFVNQTIGGNLHLRPLAAWYITLTAGTNQDDEKNFLNSAFASNFNTEQDNVVFQNDITVADQLVTLGVSYGEDRVDSSVDYVKTTRDDTGTFIQYQGEFGDQSLQLALRHDRNQQFGDYNTGTMAWGYKFLRELRLVTSYGTAFKAPTFNELYYPGFGNPNLKPEKSRSVEVDLKGSPRWGSWSIGLYQTRIDQLIAFDPSTFIPANISAVQIRGVEGTVSARLAEWDITANATLLRPEDLDVGPEHGNLLPRRAEEVMAINLDRTFGRFSFGGDVLAHSGRYDDLANTTRLGGYALVDLRAAYTLTKVWQFRVQMANVLNKHYETAAFFNRPGRSFMVTVRYQPTST